MAYQQQDSLKAVVSVSILCQTASSITLAVCALCKPIRGLSIYSLVFCTMSFGFKYHEYRKESENEILYYPQYWVRMLILIIMSIIFCTSLSIAEFDYRTHKRWIAGALITSFVSAIDNYTSIDFTSKDYWIFGSYLDVIAWIPQFPLILKATEDNSITTTTIFFYLMSMFLYDITTLSGISYDYYVHKQYGNVGYKLVFLKVLIYCDFLFRICCAIKNDCNEDINTNDPIELGQMFELRPPRPPMSTLLVSLPHSVNTSQCQISEIDEASSNEQYIDSMLPD